MSLIIDTDFSEDFPKSNKIYLNSASVSLMPLQSIRAMEEFLVSYNAAGPDSQRAEAVVTQRLHGARRTIAQIISCQPDEIVFTQSTTDGINFVANGLSFGAGSNMVVRGMEHEHPANLYPWLRLREREGVLMKSLPVNPDDGTFSFDDLESYIDDATRLVAFSHALYNTGAIMPLEKIHDVLEEKRNRQGTDITFFVDAAQTIGNLGMIDVSKMGCNFMSFNGSKWLCGPMGTGIFYCRRDSGKMLDPVSIGAESAMTYDNGVNLAFKDMPDRFQAGFRNYVGIVGLESSLEYLLRFGLQNIHQRNKILSTILMTELAGISGITMYGPMDLDHRTSILSFNIEGVDPQKAVDVLDARENIVLAVRKIMDKKVIRISPHFFNTESEMLRTVDAIKRLPKMLS